MKHIVLVAPAETATLINCGMKIVKCWNAMIQLLKFPSLFIHPNSRNLKQLYYRYRNRTTMENLPNELLTEICNYLDDEDLLKFPFRIISRVLSPVVMKRRWRHVSVCLEKTRLQSLIRIGAKRGLRELVTRITITMESPRYMAPKDFLKQAWIVHETRRILKVPGDTRIRRRPKPSTLNSQNFHAELGQTEATCDYCQDMSLLEQWQRGMDQIRAWKEWRAEGKDVSLLKEAFALLPNLRIVRIDNSVGLRRVWDANDPPFFYDGRYHHLAYTISGRMFLETIVKAVSESHTMRPTFRNMRNHRPSIYGKQAVYLMLGDLTLIVARDCLQDTFGSNLEELEVTTVFTTPFGLFHRGTIGVSSIDACIPIIFRQHLLPFLVQVPKALRILKVDTWDEDACPPRRRDTPFLPVRHSRLPPRFDGALSSLDLEGFCTTEELLKGLLVGIKQSLRKLRLCNITLTAGTWPSLFDQIGGQFHLDDLKLEYLKNCGRELREMTGNTTACMLALIPKAQADMRDWMCGAADFQYSRVLMCNIHLWTMAEGIRLLHSPTPLPQTMPDVRATPCDAEPSRSESWLITRVFLENYEDYVP